MKIRSDIWPNINNRWLWARHIRSSMNPNEWLRSAHTHARTINWPSTEIIRGLNTRPAMSFVFKSNSYSEWRAPTRGEYLIKLDFMNIYQNLSILVPGGTHVAKFLIFQLFSAQIFYFSYEFSPKYSPLTASGSYIRARLSKLHILVANWPNIRDNTNAEVRPTTQNAFGSDMRTFSNGPYFC